MAIATRTLRDTVVEASGCASGGKVTVLVNMDDNTTENSNILDASGLSGHANGAKLDITRIWWQLVQGTADDNTGHVQIQFKGASSDTTAIQLLVQVTMMVLLVRLQITQLTQQQLQET